jgi:hypothetical protein
MTELVHVTAVEVVGDHCLRLTFEDGAEGDVDLRAGTGVVSSTRSPIPITFVR